MFRRVLRAFIPAIVCLTAAMFLYPGGTRLDDTTAGYQMSRNFLSDLGRTVAYNGETNTLTAVLFALSVLQLLTGFGLCLTQASRFHQRTRAQSWVRAAIAAGVAVVVLFSGVAFTPDDEYHRLHSQFTHWGFRVLPLVPAMLAVAGARDGRLPRFSSALWALLTLVLTVYVLVLEWGPSMYTPSGLFVQVVWQKTAVFSAIGVLLLQSYIADRAAAIVPTDRLSV